MQTILLVEDQEQVRTVVCRMLDRLGFAVLTARDGGDAVELSQKHQGAIHLLLTDVVMPGMTAADLSERIGGDRLGLRTIYMSGYPNDMLARSLEEAEVSTVLRKPFNMAALRDAIEGLIGLMEVAS